MRRGVSIIIPTCNGGQVFSKSLERIGQQEYEGQVQLIVVDSGSADGTAELARKSGALVKRIDKTEFHHARTRNRAISLADFEQIVFTVQDAIPCSDRWLYDLTLALNQPDISAVYTDQIPHDDADLYARFEIESISEARGREPVFQHLDSRKAFQEMPYDSAYRAIGLDNVCAIYKKELLVKNPFPEVDFAEDMAWALNNLLAGNRILYQPEIRVKHSHNRPPVYIFKRQIVNSFWCAKIMQRVRKDLSFLRLRDLMGVMNGVRGCAVQIGQEMRGTLKIKPVLDEIVKGFPLKYRVKFFLDSRFSKTSNSQAAVVNRIRQQLEEEIRHLLHLVSTKYRDVKEEEYTEVLEHIAANVMGRTFGEVYASCMLQGSVPHELQNFMKPWLNGV